MSEDQPGTICEIDWERSSMDTAPGRSPFRRRTRPVARYAEKFVRPINRFSNPGRLFCIPDRFGKLPQLGKGQNEVTQGENREKAGLTESSIEQLTLKRFHVALEQIYRRAKATEGVVRLRQR